jgi:hypothetical protein
MSNADQPHARPPATASIPRFLRGQVFVKELDVRRNCRSNFKEVILDQCMRRVDAAERVFGADVLNPLSSPILPEVRSPISKRLDEERLQVLGCGILELAPAFGVTLSALHIPVRHCEFNAAAAEFVLMF